MTVKTKSKQARKVAKKAAKKAPRPDRGGGVGEERAQSVAERGGGVGEE